MLHRGKPELQGSAGSGHVLGVIKTVSAVQSLLKTVSCSEVGVTKAQLMSRNLDDDIQTGGALRAGLSALESLVGTGSDADQYARRISGGAFVVALPADNGYERSIARAALTRHGADAIRAFDAQGVPATTQGVPATAQVVPPTEG